jgi:hypothetical protein
MSRAIKLFVAAAAFAAFCAPAVAGGNANFALGVRTLGDDDFWEPVEEHLVLGVTVDFGKEGWPIQLAVGAYGSSDEEDFGGAEITGSVGELSFGVLKVWKHSGGLKPYVGGGVSAVNAEGEADIGPFSIDDDDTSPGLYGQGGIAWRLGERFNLGFDARILLGTDVELFGVEGDADYFQVGVLLGWGWD